MTSSAQSSRAGSSDTSDTLKVRKRKATRQISPVHQRLESDSEDDGGEIGEYEYKRRRDLDRNRKLGCREVADRDAVMTHQADIEIAEYAKSGIPENVVRLKFQYPNAVQRERLVCHKGSYGKANIVSGTIYSGVKMHWTRHQRLWTSRNRWWICTLRKSREKLRLRLRLKTKASCAKSSELEICYRQTNMTQNCKSTSKRLSMHITSRSRQ